MAIALVVLAVGAVLAGYVGVPGVLGGENRLERFLEPSFVAAPTEGAAGETPAVFATLTDQEAQAAAPAGDRALEGRLMLTSTLVAFAGTLTSKTLAKAPSTAALFIATILSPFLP